MKNAFTYTIHKRSYKILLNSFFKKKILGSP